MKTNRCNPLLSILRHFSATTAIVISFFGAAQAANTNRYWDGGTTAAANPGNAASAGGVGNWDTTITNWDLDPTGTNHVAWVNSNNDYAVFGGTAGTVTLTTGITANKLTFNTTGYTVAGNTLTLAGTAPEIATGTSISTNISSVLAGSSGLTKSGAGTLTINNITAANTFTGGTTISGGMLSIGTGGTAADTARVDALSSGAVTINSGATLRLWIKNTGTYTIANNFTVNGGTIHNEDGIDTLSGTVAVGASGATLKAVYDTKNLTLSGVVSGSGPVTVTAGGGTVLLTNTANTFSGGTTLSSGRLSISAGNGLGSGALNITKTTGDSGTSGTLTIANTAATTVTNAIALPAPGSAASYSVMKNATNATSGTLLTLSGNITGGGANATLLLTSNTGSDSSTTYKLTGTNTFTGKVQVYRGALIVTSSSSLGASSNALELNSNNSSSGDLRFENAMTFANPISLLSASTISSNGVNVILSGALSGTAAWNKVGAGTLTLTNNNSASGATSVTAGTLQLDYTTNNGSKLADGAGLTFAGGTLDLAGSNVTPHVELVASTTVSSNSSLTRTGATANQIALGAISSTGGTLNIGSNSIATTTNTLTNGLLPSYITVGGAPATTNGSNEIIAASGLVEINRLGGQISSAAGTNVRIIEGGVAPDYVSMATAGTTDIATLTNNGTGATVVDIGSGNTLRLAATGAISAGSNGLTISNGSLTAGGAADTAGLLDIFNSSGTATTINSAVTDNGTGIASLTKSGAGVVVLNGLNTYTGTTTINVGTLALAGGNAIANTGFITMPLAGGTLRVDASEVIGSLSAVASTTVNLQANALTVGDSTSTTVAGVITGTGGSLVKVGTGTLLLTGTNTYTGGTTISAGTLQVNSTGSLTGTVAVGASGTLALNAAGSTFANTLTDSGKVTLTLGSGNTTTTLSGNLSGFTGTLDLSTGGKLNLSATGANRLAAGATIKINSGGTLYQSSAATSLSSAIQLYGGTTGEALGQVRLESGATLSGAVTLFGSTTVGNNVSGSTAVISGNISESGGSYGITKLAPGAITLSGTNTYTGPTTLSAGTLNITGVTGSSALSMAASTTLGGEGTVASLTTAGASTLVANPQTTAAFTSTGTLTLGGTMTVTLSAPPTGSSIRILNHGGTTATAANFALTNASTYRNPVFSVTATTVDLSVDAAANLTWTATGGANWDVNTTSNWSSTTPPTITAAKFYAGDAVVFDDTAGSNQTVNLTTTVQPTAITFNNSTYSYTLTAGAGLITGTTGVTKNGTNVVTLGGASGQNFTGAIAVNAGTLKMGSTYGFGYASGVTIANGATVDINGQTPGTISTGGYTYTIAGTGVGGVGAITTSSATYAGTNAGIKNLVLSDDASIGGNFARFDVGSANTAGTGTITGNGKTLTKIGTNPMGFHGDASGSPINIVVNGGNIWTEEVNSFGGSNGTLTINNGAKAGTYNAITVVTPVTLNTGGSIYNEGNGTGTWTGQVTLGGNASIATSGSLINIAGSVVGSSTLTVSGSGTGLLSGTNSGFTGKIIVDTDILRVSQDAALGAVPASLVADAITLTNGGRIQTGNATAGLDVTLDSKRGITLSTGGGGFQSWGGFTTTYNGPIVGSGVLIKSDTGTANLGGTNTNTGGISISAGGGKLILSGTNNLGTTNGITINGSGDTLQVASTGSVTTGAVSMGYSAGSVLIVDGTLSATSFSNSWRAGNGSTTGVTINGTMTVSGGYTYSINDTTALNGTGTLNVGSFTMSNATTNVLFGANGLTLNNAGMFTMSSTNTFTQSAGTVNHTSSTADDLRIGASGTGTYNLNGGTYNALNTPTTIAYSSTGVFNVAAGTTANVKGFKFGQGSSTSAGTLSIAGGTVNIGASGIADGSTGANAITVTLGAATIGARANWTGTPSMALTNGATTTFNTLDAVDNTTGRTITLSSPLTGGTGALTKSGAGTLSLAGANTYTGATTVNGGKLHTGTSLASTSVTVNAGATIQPGTLSTAGTSTVPALNLNGGGIVLRAAYSGGDKMVISGTDAFTVAANTQLTVVPAGDLMTGDRIPLIDYTGTVGGAGVAGLLAPTLPNPHYAVTLDAGNPLNAGEDNSMVVLVVGAASAINWTGVNNGNWDEGASGTENWKLESDSSTTKFYNLDIIKFDDGGVTQAPVVTLVGTIAPSSVTVSNMFDAYTFQGAPITGAATLAKSGDGTLTLAAANAHTGTTTLSAGTLNLNHAQALGTGTFIISGGAIDNTTAAPLTLTSGNAKNLTGSFAFTGTQALNLGAGTVTLSNNPQINVVANTLTVDSVVAGATGLIKAGAGTLLLNGANSYTGATTVNGGTLEVTNNASGVGKQYTLSAGATLKQGYAPSTSWGGGDGVTVNGTSAADLSGLYLKGGVSYQFGATLKLQTAPSTVRAYGTGNATLSGGDVNSTHMSVLATGSGSVIGSTVKVDCSGYGYRINVVSGSNNATGDVTIDGDISGSGTDGRGGFASNLLKYGNGSLKITGANNTLTGGVWVAGGGKLILSGGTNRLPASNTVSLGEGTSSSKLVLDGVSQTLVSVITSGTGTANAVVGGSSTLSTLTINNAAAVAFAGKLGGTAAYENNLALVKNGAETLTLSGANSYTGNTTVNAGTLNLTSTSALSFVLGNAGVTNSVSGAGTASFNGTFNIDTSAVTASSGTWNVVTVTNKTYHATTFSVNGFVDPEDDGIWTKADTGGRTWSFNEATGAVTLVTVITDPYVTWSSQITNGLTQRTDDADGDGFSNLQEYLFGTLPMVNDGALTSTEVTGGDLIIRWKQRTSGASYQLKESSSLNNDWINSSVTPVDDGAESGGYQPKKATITLGSGKSFFRVEGVDSNG